MKRKWLRTVWHALFVSGVFLGFSSCTEGTGPPQTNPYNARLQFEQLDFNVEGMPMKDSPWGSVVLNLVQPGAFTGSGPLLNVAVDNRWVIQNVPVLFDPKGGGEVISYTYYFDLGVPYGTDVAELEYAFELTADVRLTMPNDFRKASVADRSFIMSSGIRGESLLPIPPLVTEKGDRVVGQMWANLGYFPNQECGVNECVPAAVSNSLNFLNGKYNLGMSTPQMDIITMKQATGWDNGCAGNWPDNKDAWMKKYNYPITTRTETNFDQIINDVKAGQDVEVYSPVHCAAVRAIGKMADGRYILYVAHDTKQGEKGGLRIEKVIFDPTTGTFEGAPGFNGLPLYSFTVECPK